MNFTRKITNNQDHFWIVQNDLEEISQSHDLNDTYFSNISVSIFETLGYMFSEECKVNEVMIDYNTNDHSFSVKIYPVNGDVKVGERLEEILTLVCDNYKLNKDLQNITLEFDISGMMQSKSTERIRQFINYSTSKQRVSRNILTNGEN